MSRSTGVDDSGRLHVALAVLDLHLPGVTSLKGKRALVRRASAALVNELGASVAEIGNQDVWQVASLGVAVASSTATGADRVLDRVRAVVERDPNLAVTGCALEASTFDREDHDPDRGMLAGILADPFGHNPLHDTDPYDVAPDVAVGADPLAPDDESD